MSGGEGAGSAHGRVRVYCNIVSGLSRGLFSYLSSYLFSFVELPTEREEKELKQSIRISYPREKKLDYPQTLNDE